MYFGVMQPLEQLDELEKKLGSREELISVAEEAKSVLMDQLSEKQSDYDLLKVELEEAECLLEEERKNSSELMEQHKTLIAQVAAKDIEIETFQKSNNEQISRNEELKSENDRLMAEKGQMTSRLQKVKKKTARKRSISLQKISSESTHWEKKEQEAENKLSDSLEKLRLDETHITGAEVSSLSQSISEAKDYMIEFKEFQQALLHDWKQRSKTVKFPSLYSLLF